MTVRRRTSQDQRHSGPLVGVLVRALLNGEELRSREAACVLQDKTTARYFSGKHRIRHWCCRLTALARVIVENGWLGSAAMPAAPATEQQRYWLFLAIAPVV